MKNIFKIDWLSFASVMLLAGLGLTAICSVSIVNDALDLRDFTKQMTALGIGLCLAAFFSLLDYRVLNTFSTRFYFGGIFILAAVLIFGTTMRGATAWIKFGSFHFEPVEMVKVVMIIFLASFLSKKKAELSMLLRIVASIVLVFIPVLLIMKQPDFGSASIIVGIWGGMLIASGISKKGIFSLLLIGIVSAGSGWFFLKDYQKDRIVNFVNPENDPLGSGYNVIQSTIAVGSGGIFGKGLGHGSQSQLNFIPEKHTDFIFAVIAEELGLLGAAIVLGLYGIIFYRMRETARLARDNFGYLLSIGIMSMIFIQIFVNIGMNIGMVPVTGVPLPFLSYGGSSLVSMLAAIGILQSVFIRRIKAA
ncbi:MAG TPA: rod shape-determining protein RodA [Candidatus Moranbacteria bacterium]|nr:rod shape-determining protein RodA [Candidatus Moranbacteria bacterium]